VQAIVSEKLGVLNYRAEDGFYQPVHTATQAKERNQKFYRREHFNVTLSYRVITLGAVIVYL
jgi:hypothetical protein